jgi:hypothetical protein
MSSDLSGEIRALNREIQALTRGLLMQQQMLRTMDEKLNCLLRAATSDGGGDLEDLLARMVKGIEGLAEGQIEIIALLRASVH